MTALRILAPVAALTVFAVAASGCSTSVNHQSPQTARQSSTATSRPPAPAPDPNSMNSTFGVPPKS